MSHSSLIRLLDKVGEGYDDKVKKWRDTIITHLDSSDEIVSFVIIILEFIHV